ncbi:hypothetical protein [Trinickia fusca]|uniref:Uncharacterized protein n=1 Tax=Trinickia fusca TaxID=2419777 RepID=A0A494XJR4_9BURK|nr:hypothetical protein [Trinickia fusca]RKP50967.1 hypothetical protein D7S89_07890 [Trinickia fusca]
MSAPDNSSSKARPSLLSDTAQGATDNGSRILANLEGRVPSQQAKRPRSRKPFVAAAVAAVVGIGAFGAWQWQHLSQADDDGGVAAQVDSVQAHASAASSVASASAAVAAPASGMALAAEAAQKAAASAPQAAVIVSEDAAHPDGKPASAAAAAPSSSADASRLSRALANGAEVASGAAASAPASAAVAKAAVAPKAAAKPAPHETAKNARTAAHAASVHPNKHAKAHGAQTPDDSDADLLAVLVARTKPYHKPAASEVAAKAPQPASVQHVSLKDQLSECDKQSFFQGETCRWRVCAGHWGKDPACPTKASAQSQ